MHMSNLLRLLHVQMHKQCKSIKGAAGRSKVQLVDECMCGEKRIDSLQQLMGIQVGAAAAAC